MGRKRRRTKLKLKIRTETLHSIVAVLLILFGVLVLVSFSGQGELLQVLNQFLTRKFGLSMLFFPFVFVSAGLVMFRTKWAWSKPHVLLGTLLLMTATMGVLQAGEIGVSTFDNLAALITPVGSYTFFGSLAIIGALIITQWSISEVVDLLANLKLSKRSSKKDGFVTKGVGLEDVKKARGFSLPKLSMPSFNKKEDTKDIPTPQEPSKAAQSTDEKSKTDIQMEGLSPSSTPIIWEPPPLSLLSDTAGGKANRGDVRKNAQIIENTLDSFGIKARVAEVNFGPAVTQYALEITRGTKLSRITGLSTDLALSLAAPTGQVRIEAPIVGRSLVGVEVPNHSAQYVSLKKMLSSPEMKKAKSKLTVALGLNVSGKPVVTDISRMPHLLIAGATGSGKSVAINAFMCSILFRASPAEVKFILVDPKRVELTGYNGIPHLLTPVIVDPNKVVSALKWATHLMDERYKQLAEVGVKNISSYNELAGLAAMPNIVIVIDELADIMLFSPSEVEESVTRIAQMARAVGIHLVLATQRPSVDVITGLIKANIPARIAFNVSSLTDSRVILDQPGAEKLLGRGDMLFIPPDQAKPTRIQGTYVSEREAKQLVDFIKSQGHQPNYEEDITSKYKAKMVGGGTGPGTDVDDRDDKFIESVKLFSQYDKASSSLIQRRMSVGYARAARILDQLYEAGMVGPPDGSKPREVFHGKVREYLSTLTTEE